MSKAQKYTPDETELIDCYAGAMEEQAGENYDEAKADAERGIQAIKAKARAEAFNDARRTMQLSLDAAINPLRAEAWDEGFRDGRRQDSEGDDGPKFVNPYRQEEASDDQ
ncbi:hypothetical protein [Brevibacterium sediminis]|uniref:hypothetical protein n=1 Tax=Brevibacterium sediminis TaxID=1857024 RepID=UPI00367154D5